MKILAFIGKFFKTIVWTVMAVILLVVAVLVLLYSPWSQNMLREGIVAVMNRSGMEMTLGSFALRFPAAVDIADMTLRMPDGMAVSARRLEASVSPLGILKGSIDITSVSLTDGTFSLGAPDSAMYLTVAGREITLDDASVALGSLSISVDDGAIRGAHVSLMLNPDTTATDSVAPAPPTDLKINLRRMVLEDFAYDMRMLPVIDSLGATIRHGDISNVDIDLLEQTISIGGFVGNRLDAAYIAPDSATIAATPVAPPAPVDTTVMPWTIRIDTIGFDHSHALYTTQGVIPLPGLDFAYIEAGDLSLGIKDFYNRETIVRVPLTLKATERCGVTLDASGTLDINADGIGIDGFKVATPNGTDLDFTAFLGTGDMTTDPTVPLRLDLDGGVAIADARLMFPAFAPYFITLPQTAQLHADVNVDGTAGDLRISDIDVSLYGIVRLQARGRVKNAFDPDHIGGNIALSGALIDLNRFKPVIFDKETAKQFNLPLTTFNGSVNMVNGSVSGDLTARTGKGKISLDGKWNSHREDYSATLTVDRFPVNAFMPLLGVGEVSADFQASGHGYNPFVDTMKFNADLNVTQAVYDGYDYSGIEAYARLADGDAVVNLHSSNPNVLFDIMAEGNLSGTTYDWDVNVSGDHINLQALGFMPDEAVLETHIVGSASITPDIHKLSARLKLESLDYTDEIATTTVKNVVANLNANDSVTNLSVYNRDLYAFLSADAPLDTLIGRFAGIGAVIDSEIAEKTVNVERIQQALPPFTLDISAGTNNILTDILAESRTRFKVLDITASNHETLSLEARMLDFSTPTMKFDTITFDLSQYANRLAFSGKIENRPGTFDEWAHVNLDGYLADNTLGIRLAQRNIKNQEGYNLGADIELNDSTVTLSLEPTDPTIGYMPWTINEGNFISYSFAHKHIDANLKMHSAVSSLEIYTHHVEGQDADHQEELTVALSDIKLADWIKINPFAPAIDGMLSADMSLSMEDGNINGKGGVTLADFTYGKQRVGTIGTSINVTTTPTGTVRANADMSVNGARALTLSGALNDSTAGSPLAMDLSLIHFPLSTVNPFLPEGVASLSGSLNGSMDVRGHGTAPRLDGWLQFDSTAVRVDMIGTSYKFNSVRIPVDSNIVRFNNFAISGVNENPLTINGTVNINELSNPAINLTLAARNMQICNTNRLPKGADIYGKGFITLNSTIKGNMQYLAIDANVTVNSGTNITYVIPDAVSTLQNQANTEMVKFVNFADTAAVLEADKLTTDELAMMVEASLTIQSGSTINVDLSSNGRDRVSLQPEGVLDFSMPPFGAPRLTGRMNIPKGFVRYTPPILSEKYFTFDPSSYVAFTGDVMNPTLHVKAVDVIKANVTQTGQNSRLVNFDVSVAVTGTLDHMDVGFDLSTTDDMTVANELQSMSKEQRANQAMNMLLYGIYSGAGTTGNSNLSNNAVYSFLASQLNNWAASNIKGVDLTFGIDQYDRTYNGSTSQTTSYSYQVSKSLFNDRFKIVVGGNYSTDANAEENFSQNLIKDISFEYYLNAAQTMYVRIFRHTGYESILEGEVTRTGVGFVYKRKMASLRNLFPRRRKKQNVRIPKDPGLITDPASEKKSTELKKDDESK